MSLPIDGEDDSSGTLLVVRLYEEWGWYRERVMVGLRPRAFVRADR